ncbi:hypothetical protein PybrP1_004953 [[Pythium] brassicae (nom. inval.)]|nr:hypothetical protein PybrP1_004953 [[Pythium] brassicae (nom. inval.)]
MEAGYDRGLPTSALQGGGAGGRASEHIQLDVNLPAPAQPHLRQQQQLRSQQQQQSVSSGGSTRSAASSSVPARRPKRKSMPRLENLLPPVHITEEQKAELKQAAENRIASMLTRCQAAWDGTDGIFEEPEVWKLHSSKPNLSVYRRRSKSALQYHPFVATGHIITPRDNAFMQYTKTVTNKLGEKILVKVGSLRFVRSELSLIYMYHYDPKAKEVQVFCEGNIDPAGRSRSMVANLNLSLFAPVIVNLASIADAKFITKHGIIFPHGTAGAGKMSVALSVSTHIASPIAASTRADSLVSHLTASWVPDRERKACYVCFKSFGLLWRHRHHCRMCGEVMCSQCTTALPLVAPPEFDATEDANFPLQNQPAKKKLEDSNRHGFPVVNLFKFCKKCIFMVRQERRAMAASVGDYYFTEGMLRHREQMQAAFAGRYLPPFADDDGASGFPDDDESIVDDVQYSQRIEKLRQEHMAREKQKLRDQQQQRNGDADTDASASVRLFDDEEFASVGSSYRKQSIASSDVSFDFDNLFVTDPRTLASLKMASERDDLGAFPSSVAGAPGVPLASNDSPAP